MKIKVKKEEYNPRCDKLFLNANHATPADNIDKITLLSIWHVNLTMTFPVQKNIVDNRATNFKRSHAGA